VEGFKKVHREKITTSLWYILGEAMSAFRPRSTATSKLPNIYVILRKPKTLGSEFKYVACPVVGTIKCLEIQRGAKPMINAKYSKEHGCTSGCSLRLADASDQHIEPGQKRGMKGDSWFGHTHLADKLGTQGVRAVLQITTGHALFPAKFLDEELAEAPGGCWITMAGKGPCGTNLLASGYKYNSKRVLKFVATTDAGSKKAGTPYYMIFTDAYSNVCVCKDQRPVIISTFFNDLKCVDSHNHVRQYELALEKKWLTQDPFFRLHTTLTGMTVADEWKLASFHKLISNAKDEEGKPVISKKKFSGNLSRQFINISVRLP
jgi:hypothetical protein